MKSLYLLVPALIAITLGLSNTHSVAQDHGGCPMTPAAARSSEDATEASSAQCPSGATEACGDCQKDTATLDGASETASGECPSGATEACGVCPHETAAQIDDCPSEAGAEGCPSQTAQAEAGCPSDASGCPSDDAGCESPLLALGATSEQVTRVEALKTELSPQLAAGHLAIAEAEELLSTAMNAETPDQTAVFAAVDSVHAARADFAKLRIAAYLGMREILGREMADQLQTGRSTLRQKPAAVAPAAPAAPATPAKQEAAVEDDCSGSCGGCAE
ncbi:periplasmic heavy metal sensor [Planctomycetota bacterium]|nr:periplasmic heavy metal sensor [Planctomycetota bacterium]